MIYPYYYLKGISIVSAYFPKNDRLTEDEREKDTWINYKSHLPQNKRDREMTFKIELMTHNEWIISPNTQLTQEESKRFRQWCKKHARAHFSDHSSHKVFYSLSLFQFFSLWEKWWMFSPIYLVLSFNNFQIIFGQLPVLIMVSV